MGISILDNFDYRAGKPNFTRDLFATVEEMVAFPEMYLPSVFECNIADTGDRYRYNVNNDVDPVTGKWRLVTGGTGGSVDGITVPTKTSDLTNDSGFITSIPSEYITETELETKGYLTEHQSLTDYAKKIDIPDVSSFITSDDLPTVPTKVSDLENDRGYLTSIPEEYITETELNAKGYLTSHQDISNLQTKTDNSLTTTDKTVTGAINEVNGSLLDTVGFSADYKNIILNRKNGLNPYTIPISAIINNASLAELKDVDSTDVGDGKTLVYDGITNKHKYVDSSITDEFVKMDSTTDAKYLSDLIDKSTVVNDNGVLKVKKLDGQEVTITEINYLKGLTMNVMDLVNAFSNGGVKVLNTPLNTASELDTMDRTSFTDGISYIVYVLADETHSSAKTTYLCTKTSTTFFGNADSQRNFTTNPIDLANEVTGKLGTTNIDVDNLWTLLTINDTYKTLTTNNEIFGTHGAKAMYDELATDIGGKANATDLTTHTGDANIHVTTIDKAKWDKVTNKLDTVDFNTHKDNTDIHITSAERTKWDKVDEKVDKTDIVDNLTSADTDKPLSANQGKILNDTKLNKTDANKLNCVTIDNVSLKEYILTNFTEKEKTYYLIAKTTCTDLPKASNFYITVETPGLYTYKVTAKELNDSNGIYVCTYRTISSSWTAWEKELITGDIIANDSEVVKKTDITDTIDINSSDIKIPNVKAIYNDIIEGKNIDQTAIDTYGTEILKYPLGIWRISDNNISNKFTDLPVKVSGRIEITSIKTDTNRNPWNNNWSCRTYNFETCNRMNYFRKITSAGEVGVKTDTGWQKVCGTSVEDVPNTVIVSENTNVKLNSNCYYTVINGVCYVTLWGFTCTEVGQHVVNSSMPKTRLTMKGLCTYGRSGYEGGCAFVFYDNNGNNKLYIESKITDEPLYGSFSYPVAE